MVGWVLCVLMLCFCVGVDGFGWGCVVRLSDGLCICCSVGLLIVLRCGWLYLCLHVYRYYDVGVWVVFVLCFDVVWVWLGGF